jgi:CubicO group peptidase (beta-lactamase class C family)
MNRRRALLPLAAILVAAAAVNAQPQDIDEFIKGWIERQHVPAVAVAVIKDGEAIKLEGYGLADVENRVPARADTVFKIGSLSKQFLATAIMLLVQDGKVALDNKIGTYLQGAPKTWDAITLRHLLTHTSGLVLEASGFDFNKVQPDTLNDGRKFPYGFGWQLDDWPADSKVPTGVPMVRHGGSLTGLRAGYTRWPNHRLTVIVLTNLANAPYEGLTANIAIRYVPQLKTTPVLIE